MLIIDDKSEPGSWRREIERRPKNERELFAQLRDYLRMIESLEKENAELRRIIEELEEPRVSSRDAVMTALKSGARTARRIGQVTGRTRQTINRVLIEAWRRGELRRRGPIVHEGRFTFVYGRKLRS